MKKIFLFLAMMVGFAMEDTEAVDLSKLNQEDVLYIDIDAGRIIIMTFPQVAPNHVARVKELAREGFYDGTIFHRVIPSFMVQGGGFTAQMVQKSTNDPIKNEADNGLHNVRGTLAMARTSDVNSATSQFFINVVDNSMLDHGNRDFGYAVFGKVVKGMDVVDQIVNVQTGSKNGMQNVPLDPILIKSAKRVN